MKPPYTEECLLYVAGYARDRSHDDRQPDYERNLWQDVAAVLDREAERLAELRVQGALADYARAQGGA